MFRPYVHLWLACFLKVFYEALTQGDFEFDDDSEFDEEDFTFIAGQIEWLELEVLTSGETPLLPEDVPPLWAPLCFAYRVSFCDEPFKRLLCRWSDELERKVIELELPEAHCTPNRFQRHLLRLFIVLRFLELMDMRERLLPYSELPKLPTKLEDVMAQLFEESGPPPRQLQTVMKNCVKFLRAVRKCPRISPEQFYEIVYPTDPAKCSCQEDTEDAEDDYGIFDELPWTESELDADEPEETEGDPKFRITQTIIYELKQLGRAYRQA